MLTKQKIEEIRARCEAATSGPWGVRRTGSWPAVFSHDDGYGIASTGSCRPRGGVEVTANCRFIAASRTDIPLLLSEIERLNKVVEEVEENYRNALRIMGGAIDFHGSLDQMTADYLAWLDSKDPALCREARSQLEARAGEGKE